jgi:hypothetical protein
VRIPLLWLLGLALAGCATAQPIEPDDPSRPPPPEPDALAPIDVVKLAHEVETVRHLTVDRPVDAKVLDDEAFRERFFGSRAPGGDTAATSSFWTAFGFASRSLVVRDAQRRLLDSSVVGFYDTAEKALFLRGGTVEGGRIAPKTKEQQFVLAHEIEHAIQDQHFGIALAKAEGPDERLAYKGLVEGDAVLTEVAVRAQRAPGTDHWVSRVTGDIRAMPEAELLRRAGLKAKELAAAPLLLQRTVRFPYHEGTAFVADLYRTGGLKLINRAFANPPRSTEQVMHPDRYLAGDRPVPVPAPVPADGWQLLARGTLGELVTSIVLEQCMAHEDAAKAARGWGGDTYAVVGNGDRTAILWSTVWDDEAAAARFAEAATERGDCLRTKGLEPGVGGDVVVRRQGARVAFVQGLGADAGQTQAAALLAVPVEIPAASPPFGALTVPPLVVPEKAFLHQGGFVDDVWVNEVLGMRMKLPEGFRPVRDSAMEVEMKHDPDAHAAFTMLMMPPSKEVDERYLQQVLAQQREHLETGQSLDYVAASPMLVDGVYAPSRTWRTTKGGNETFAFVPACDGLATVVLQVSWAGLDGALAVEEWVGRFKRPDVRSAACSYLKKSVD